MRNIIFNICLLFCFLFSFTACEKDEDKVTIKSDIAANQLDAMSDDTFALVLDNAANLFQTFNWTPVDYGFKASVVYKVQFDTAGNNFSEATDVLTVTSSLEGGISVSDFNKMLLNKEYEAEVPCKLEFRVAAIVNSNVDPVYSNVVNTIVIPYATVFPPIYMCGAATGGWDWTKDVEMRSTAPSVYYTIGYFISGETFRFFKQRDWGPTSYNYPFFDGGSVSDSLINADDGDKNFKVVSPSGYYAITANLKTKTVDFDAVPEPMMFMTGAAVGGWDWSTNYVQMTWKRHGVFEATTEFINGETFRFFAQKDWGPTSYNYPYFADGSVSDLFENAEDGDKNFKFTGTTGNYKVTVNLLDLTVTMEAAAK